MNSKQTAVEWLVEIWATQGTLHSSDIEQAKQMEVQQLNKACYDGYYTEEWYDTRNYYKDTYGK